MTLGDVITCFRTVSTLYPWIIVGALLIGYGLGYVVGRKNE